MEYVIAFLFMVLVVCLLFKRPLNLTFTIVHKIEQDPVIETPAEKEEEDKQLKMVKDVTEAINKVMWGGDINGDQSTEGKI